jgi:hypothetical protein
MNTTKHHRFPKQILSLANLRGGDFGTLEITAIDRTRVELTLGGDNIVLTRDDWAKVRSAVDPLFGVEVEVDVTVTEPDGEVIEERIVASVLPPRRPSRRRG